MKRDLDDSEHAKWARFRFSVVGPLLSAPPAGGKLRAQLRALCEKTWKHPITGAPAHFAFSTIEHWYYTAKNSRDPVRAVRRQVRKDVGTFPSLSAPLRAAIRGQYTDHPGWSVQLHHDNLKVLVEEHPELGPLPSYATVRRFMKSQGLVRRRRASHAKTPGAVQAEARLAKLEVRSYEAQYVSGLWHSDFHAGSRKVLLRSGEWITPQLFGALDDKSRLGCHAQWYLDETAQSFLHGLSQAFQKRGLPRALMTDNGSAMTAAETRQGLEDLGILHETTLVYSPYQNAKQEVFWAGVEGRLLPMLEGIRELTLEMLNEATQAWIEMEYNRKVHSEIGTTPLSAFLAGPTVARECPDSQALRRAFRMKSLRTQRRSDGTITVEGVRFEVPGRLRHLERLAVRYARWDLASADLVDPRSGIVLASIYPVDKVRNAEAVRRTLEPVSNEPVAAPCGGMAPLLRKLMAEYAATGLPPAYVPQPLPEEKRDE